LFKPDPATQQSSTDQISGHQHEAAKKAKLENKEEQWLITQQAWSQVPWRLMVVAAMTGRWAEWYKPEDTNQNHAETFVSEYQQCRWKWKQIT